MQSCDQLEIRLQAAQQEIDYVKRQKDIAQDERRAFSKEAEALRKKCTTYERNGKAVEL